jgi:hypothetical protein
MRRCRHILATFLLYASATAQETFPVNGVADKRINYYALTNATIVKDAQTTLTNATLVIKDGKIVAVGTGVTAPKEAVTIDCSGKFIYPSFIDLYTDYGMPAVQRPAGGGGFGGPAQLNSNQKGAYGWNQAFKADVQAHTIFVADEKAAKALRDLGFGTVLTHQKDGIARGTGMVATLAADKENLLILKDKASAHYSFNKGSSSQVYPSSQMGYIAMLRQQYIDAAWYKTNPTAEGINITLQSWNETQNLPQIFDPSSTDFWPVLRADRVGDEFGVQYILRASGKEYQRIKETKATQAGFIVHLNFPATQDVEDPNDARYISLADMKHWELAATNPAALEKAGINFCLTTADLRDLKTFFTNLRKAIENGLTEKTALEALTKNPATMLGIYNQVGSLEAGKLANFIVTNGSIFSEKTTIIKTGYKVKSTVLKKITGPI